MNFSNAIYLKLKLRLVKRYQIKLKHQLKTLSFYDQGIAQWTIKNADKLNDFSCVKWNLLHQIDDFIFLNNKSKNLCDHEFGLAEEMVFEKWNHSEFSGYFLNALNEGNKINKASLRTLNVFDKHLVNFAQRHILLSKNVSRFYRIQSSLGEISTKGKITTLIPNKIQMEDKEITIFSRTHKEGSVFSNRIIKALKIIMISSPDSWERFRAFTEVIVPIKEPQFVSYSHQDLPGYSMINLYHRDFVDLMDDLLHENGHHHLNYYLNLEKLIEEPTDNIYYSPWRRTLRPLRGIYHAYFTFFWAFKLFSDLVMSDNLNSNFDSQDKEKIIWRAVEEFHMLNFTFEDLKWAKENRLIHKKGWQLVEEQKTLIDLKKGFMKKLEKRLVVFKDDLVDLKLALKKAKKDYKKTQIKN
jgi:hypothetical protein